MGIYGTRHLCRGGKELSIWTEEMLHSPDVLGMTGYPGGSHISTYIHILGPECWDSRERENEQHQPARAQHDTEPVEFSIVLDHILRYGNGGHDDEDHTQRGL